MLTVGELLLVTVICFVSAFEQGATGFGCALIAMSLLPLFFPMQVCSAISAMMIVTIGAHMTLTLRLHLRLRTVALPVLCCFLTINVGLWILDHFDELTLRVILASLLVFVTALFFIMRKRKIILPERWYSAAGAGLITGVSTGMFNIVGPFLLVYYMNICDDTLWLKASLEFSFLMAGIYSLTMHTFVYHNITLAVAPALVCTALASLAGGYFGLKLYRKINKDKIALVVYILLPIMAAMLIINGLNG